jgi:hypothetical protein
MAKPANGNAIAIEEGPFEEFTLFSVLDALEKELVPLLKNMMDSDNFPANQRIASGVQRPSAG